MMPRQQRFIVGPESPLEGVTRDAWQRFVAALEVQGVGDVSESGGLGAYDIRPRRLVELGYAVDLRSIRTVAGRQVYECDFALPWTKTRFLSDSVAQYTVLAKSIRLYYDAVRRGELSKPENCSMAGTLAILHRGGRGALKGWPDLFEDTRALYQAARGAF